MRDQAAWQEFFRLAMNWAITLNFVDPKDSTKYVPAHANPTEAIRWAAWQADEMMRAMHSRFPSDLPKPKAN